MISFTNFTIDNFLIWDKMVKERPTARVAGQESPVSPTLEYRRRSPRTPVEMPVMLLISDSPTQESPHRAVTKDFSNYGARVTSPVPLSEGQALRFIPRDVNQPSLAVPGRVIWVGQPGSEGSGQAGIEFLFPVWW